MTRPHRSTVVPALALLALVGAGQAFAQDAAQGKNVTLVGVASGTVAPNGTLYASISGNTDSQFSNSDVDGSMEFGVGIGSAENNVGVQAGIVITSLKDNLGDSGYVTLKFSRRIAQGAHPTYIGLTLDQLGGWGDAEKDDVAGTLAVTTFGRIGGDGNPYMLTIGAGSNLRNKATDPGLILGAGVGLTRSLGVSAAWSGETFDLGAGLRIPGIDEVSFSAVVNDVFDVKDSQRLTLSVNFALYNVFGG